MILHDVCINGEGAPQHICIEGERIKSISGEPPAHDGENLYLGGATVLPGLINSHDHLDFNCYPQLGDRIYHSYREWGPEIQQTHAQTIRQVQQIPLPLRIAWGLYKNLLNGFTTVVNHGPKLNVYDELISVFQDCKSLHSAAFEKNWKWKLKNPFAKGPFVMHIAEGTDGVAAKEALEIDRANLFRKKIIAVHGVSIDKVLAKRFKALVWCPASNYFLLNRTASVGSLKDSINIVFGMDSTLTSPWAIHEHFRFAKQTGVSRSELASMLTGNPAKLWEIEDRGTVSPGKTADILVIKPGKELFDLRTEDILLVIHRGKIRMADVIFTGNWQRSELPYTKIRTGDSIKEIQGRPFEIAQEMKKYYPSLFIPFTSVNE